MGQLQFITSVMMVAMFSLAIVGFAINFAIDNDAAVDISDDPELALLNTNLEDNLSQFKDSTEESYISIVKSSIDKGDTLESGGTISLTISNALPTMYNIIKVGYTKIFGDNPELAMFMTAFITLLWFIGIMYFVKTWLGRNPD